MLQLGYFPDYCFYSNMKTDTKNALYTFVKKADDLLRGNADLLNVISPVWDVYSINDLLQKRTVDTRY